MHTIQKIIGTLIFILILFLITTTAFLIIRYMINLKIVLLYIGCIALIGLLIILLKGGFNT